MAEILNNVFVPLSKILSFQSEKKTSSKYDFIQKLKKWLKDPAIEEIMRTHPDPEVSLECQKIFLGNLNVKINITKTMLEFFGSSNFLESFLHSEKENLEILRHIDQENLLLNKSNSQLNDFKRNSDPILENFLQTFNALNANPLQPQKRLKTIVSESNSSAFSINEEDIIQSMPKNFIAKNQLNGDKKLPHLEPSNEETKYDVVAGNTEKDECEEEKKMDSMGIDKIDRSGSSSSIKKAPNHLNNNIIDMVPRNKSFAMNRRGEEFLKMPSLNVLSDEDKKKKRNSHALQLEDKPDQVMSGGLGKQQTMLEKVDLKSKKDEIERNMMISKKMPSNSLDINIELNFNLLTNFVDEDVSTWDKVPGSPCVLIKAKAWLEGIHKQTIFDQIYSIDKRKKWDTVFGEFKQIEQIDEVTDVIYFLLISPFGVMNRDFVQRRVYRYDYPEKGALCIQFKSIDHPMMPPKKNCIRAETFISGYIISTDPTNKENTILQLVTQVDVKGSIPKAIVNYVASKAPIDWVNNLRKACLKN